MFIGFDYEPKGSYSGELPVAAINGSWSVMPDSTWATVAAASGSASATDAATATATGSESTRGSSAGDSGTVSASSTDTGTDSGVATTVATATDSGNSTPVTATDTSDWGSATATDSTDTAVKNAANTQLVVTAGTDSVKKRSLHKRQDSASLQYPILLGWFLSSPLLL